MQPMSAVRDRDEPLRQVRTADPFLPLQLAATAEATGALIARGLERQRLPSPLTGPDGRLLPEIEPLARAYEAALLSGFSPQEVKTLRRLLTRLETVALKLAGPA